MAAMMRHMDNHGPQQTRLGSALSRDLRPQTTTMPSASAPSPSRARDPLSL